MKSSRPLPTLTYRVTVTLPRIQESFMRCIAPGMVLTEVLNKVEPEDATEKRRTGVAKSTSRMVMGVVV